MRILLIILISLIASCTKAQYVLGILKNGSINTIGTVLQDEFTGASLAAAWTATNYPSFQSITVSGGTARIIGTSTVKNVGLCINNTGYGKSTLRNYKVEAKFKINSISSTTFGVIAGVSSQRNPDQNMSTYASIDYHSGASPALEILGTSSSNAIGVTSASATSIIPINTTDYYTLAMEMVEDVVTARLTNLTTGSSSSTSFTYDFTTPYAGNHVKPNIFYYSFGVNGTSDVTFDWVKTTSTELNSPDYLFVGNSISTGLYGGDADNCFAYKLRPHTSKSIQVMAGGHNRSSDVVDNINEIKARNPEVVFLEIGTNDLGNSILLSTIQSNVTNIIIQLNAIGCTVYTLSAPNGGSPTTSGTYNYWLKNNTNFINDYATYDSGLTVDGIHPNATGMQSKADAIKSALPSLFPL